MPRKTRSYKPRTKAEIAAGKAMGEEIFPREGATSRLPSMRPIENRKRANNQARMAAAKAVRGGGKKKGG